MKSITASKTTSADEFIKNLSIDQNGNVQVVLTDGCQNAHTVTLNRYHKCPRGQTYNDMLIKIKANLNQLKESTLENIKTNINDQCSTESCFYNWSALDFIEKISLDQRSKILDKLLEMFSRECTFTICEYTSTKDDDVEIASWEGFVVKMIYEKKIGCDKTELLDQLRSAWLS